MKNSAQASGNHIIVLVTVSSEEEGKRIADILLQKKAIACANVIREIESFFWWKGEVDHSGELLLLMKSRGKLLEKIVKLVKENHSYEVPEIVAVPIIGGSADYLRWIDESVEVIRKKENS